MSRLCSHLGVLTTLLIATSAMVGWVLIWHFRSHREGTIPSDPQIIRLLVYLLIFAAFSMGLFIIIILGKTVSWQYLCYSSSLNLLI